MDPLTALSLAVNVIAIVDVSAKLVHTTWQISKTGAKAEHVEIEVQTRVVEEFLMRLKPGLNANAGGLSQDDKNLIRLCDQSENISKQLLNMLASCKARESSSKVSLDVFWRSVKSEWKEDAIHDLQHRLEDIDAKAHQLIAVRYSSRISDQLTSLERQFQTLGTSRASELGAIEKAIQDLGKKDSGGDDVGLQLMLKAAERGGTGKEFAVQAGILSQLRFVEIDRRIHELSQRPSHEQSYLWLDDSRTRAKKAGQSPANFQAWLGSPEKLYWISGVPGSGKSTLMKFLYSNPWTKRQLADWCQRGKLLVAAYFFWEVGKITLLRTQEGLLRTLLFQILRQCPELISEVYSDLWTLFADAIPNGQYSLSSFAGSQVSLEVHQLLQKMEAACSSIASHGYHLFLLIDGLDEYEGKPSEIIHLMKALTGLPNVKICVSSRPDTAFLDVYGSTTTKLFTEDFNKLDITQYVQDRLGSHSRFTEDDDRNTLGAELISKVVENSSGVFLWVRLVMEDLEEGLTDRNTIRQLQRRLDRLPNELESFFDHILDRVSEDYREDSASMLLVTHHAHDLLPPLACWFVSERSLELESSYETKPTEARHNNKRRKDLDFRLRSYCRGLLLVQDLPLAPEYVALPSSSLFGQRVNFLHRTVREYLLRPRVAQRLDDWRPDEFNVDELICKAVRAQIRTSPHDRSYFALDGPIAEMLDIFNFHHRSLHGDPAHLHVAKDLRNGMAEVLAALAMVNGHKLSIPALDDAITGAPSQHPTVVRGDKPKPDDCSQRSYKNRLKEFFRRK